MNLNLFYENRLIKICHGGLEDRKELRSLKKGRRGPICNRPWRKRGGEGGRRILGDFFYYGVERGR